MRWSLRTSVRVLWILHVTVTLVITLDLPFFVTLSQPIFSYAELRADNNFGFCDGPPVTGGKKAIIRAHTESYNSPFMV